MLPEVPVTSPGHSAPTSLPDMNWTCGDGFRHCTYLTKSWNTTPPGKTWRLRPSLWLRMWSRLGGGVVFASADCDPGKSNPDRPADAQTPGTAVFSAARPIPWPCPPAAEALARRAVTNKTPATGRGTTTPNALAVLLEPGRGRQPYISQATLPETDPSAQKPGCRPIFWLTRRCAGGQPSPQGGGLAGERGGRTACPPDPVGRGRRFNSSWICSFPTGLPPTCRRSHRSPVCEGSAGRTEVDEPRPKLTRS